MVTKRCMRSLHLKSVSMWENINFKHETPWNNWCIYVSGPECYLSARFLHWHEAALRCATWKTWGNLMMQTRPWWQALPAGSIQTNRMNARFQHRIFQILCWRWEQTAHPRNHHQSELYIIVKQCYWWTVQLLSKSNLALHWFCMWLIHKTCNKPSAQ